MILSGTWRSSRKILFTYIALKKTLANICQQDLPHALKLLCSNIPRSSTCSPIFSPISLGRLFKLLQDTVKSARKRTYYLSSSLPLRSQPSQHLSLMPIIRSLAKGFSQASDVFLVFLITLRTSMSAKNKLLVAHSLAKRCDPRVFTNRGVHICIDRPDRKLSAYPTKPR